MEVNPNVVLEDCPICRGNGFLVHEGGWNVQVECCDCSAHTVYAEYSNEAEKAEAFPGELRTVHCCRMTKDEWEQRKVIKNQIKKIKKTK